MENSSQPVKRTILSYIFSCLIWSSITVIVMIAPFIIRYNLLQYISPSEAHKINRSCAVQCYLDGRYEEACPLVENCLLTKDEPAIRLLLGICQEKTGNLQAALANYQKCRPLLYREGQLVLLDLDERLEKLSKSQNGGILRQALQAKSNP